MNIIKTDNGIDVVNTCKEMQPHVVVLDVMQPGMDGYEVCKQIRQFSHSPILFLSSQNDELDKIINEIVVDDYDALAIPGGFEEFGFYEEAYDAKFQNLIKAFHEQNKPIVSVCVAALPLGKSGILKDRKATTYHLNNAHRQKQLAEFGVDVVNERVVVDDNIITSYCPILATGGYGTFIE